VGDEERSCEERENTLRNNRAGDRREEEEEVWAGERWLEEEGVEPAASWDEEQELVRVKLLAAAAAGCGDRIGGDCNAVAPPLILCLSVELVFSSMLRPRKPLLPTPEPLLLLSLWAKKLMALAAFGNWVEGAGELEEAAAVVDDDVTAEGAGAGVNA
jgi:hypothetical protein